MLANRTSNLVTSATLTLKSKANELKNKGKNVIELSTGEPDFPTPDFIKRAGKKAITENRTTYTPVDGILPLKNAILEKFKAENNLDYDLTNILVSSGAKHSLYNIFQAMLNPGDEVIMAAPYWVSYPEMVKLADGVPKIVDTFKDGCILKAENLQENITTTTKAIILNSPSNPSGVVYSKQDLKELADVLLKHPEIIIISDDIYEHICWNRDGFANILNVCPQLSDRTVVVNGVSKSYAMTGWRIGYAAGPKKIIGTMKKIQSHSTSCPTSISQYAALSALNGPQDVVKKMVAEFKTRHDFIFQALNEIPKIKALPGEGAFYSFPNISEVMKKLGYKTDIEFCASLIEKKGLVVVPGSAFGAPGYIRISYATNIETLKRAITLLMDHCA